MGTKYKGTKKICRALNAFIALNRAGSSLEARLRTDSVLSKENLSGTQFGVLETLLHLGPLCQYELSSKLLKTGGNTTHVLNNLLKRDLVQREEKIGDRRANVISLSGKGRELIERIFPIQAEKIATEMGTLSAPEQEELGHLCKKLGLALDGTTTTCPDNRSDL